VAEAELLLQRSVLQYNLNNILLLPCCFLMRLITWEGAPPFGWGIRRFILKPYQSLNPCPFSLCGFLVLNEWT
jgi:hypothetical protein